MAALFKYFVSIAVILSSVMVIVPAVVRDGIFVGGTADTEPPATLNPKWKIERQKTEPDMPYVAQGSLSPIYPATPGKELLGKPVYTARLAKKLQVPVSAKRIDVRQALQLHNVPRQIYAASEQDRDYPRQSLSFAETRPSQPRTLIVFGHGIY